MESLANWGGDSGLGTRWHGGKSTILSDLDPSFVCILKNHCLTDTILIPWVFLFFLRSLVKMWTFKISKASINSQRGGSKRWLRHRLCLWAQGLVEEMQAGRGVQGARKSRGWETNGELLRLTANLPGVGTGPYAKLNLGLGPQGLRGHTGDRKEASHLPRRWTICDLRYLDGIERWLWPIRDLKRCSPKVPHL